MASLYSSRTGGQRGGTDNQRVIDDRLFAVKAPDVALDITNEVLWQWAQQSAVNFKHAWRKASISYFEARSDSVVFHFATGPAKDIDIHLDWSQIAQVMSAVKASGILRRDPVWGAAYIAKDFPG